MFVEILIRLFSTAKRWDDAHPPAALESAAFGGTGGAFAIADRKI
jgi:hypothetical protein